MHLGEVDLLFHLTLGHVAADPGLARLDLALADLELLLGEPQNLFLHVTERLVLSDDARAAGLEVHRVVLGQDALGLSGLGVVLDPHGQDRPARGQCLLEGGTLVQLDLATEQRAPQGRPELGTAGALDDRVTVEGVHIRIGETGGFQGLLGATAGGDLVEQDDDLVALG